MNVRRLSEIGAWCSNAPGFSIPAPTQYGGLGFARFEASNGARMHREEIRWLDIKEELALRKTGSSPIKTTRATVA